MGSWYRRSNVAKAAWSPSRHRSTRSSSGASVTSTREGAKGWRDYSPASISNIRSKPEYWKTSRRCRFTPARRSFALEAIRRFCVLRSTPRPALEMYSSFVQSSVTGPCTLSRKDWATGHCAASSRPAITTTPSPPKSIASIVLFLNSKPDLTLPAFLDVTILDGLDQPANQMQPQSSRLALFDRRFDVDIGGAGGVERRGVVVGKDHFDPVRHLRKLDPQGRLTRMAIFHHIGEQLFQNEIDRGPDAGLDAFALESVRGEGEDVVDRLEAPLESAAGTPRGLALHQHHRHVVLLRRARRERPDRVEERGGNLGHGFAVVVAKGAQHASLAELLAVLIVIFVYAVGNEGDDVPRPHLEDDRGLAQRGEG